MRDYEFYYTQDGSIGLYSYADDDVYHSKFGAVTEAWEKFIIPSGITNLINTKEEIKVLDVCYGIGYNTKSLMSFVINHNKNFLKNKKKFYFFNNFLKKKKLEKINNTVSVDANNNSKKQNLLSEYNEPIGVNNLSTPYAYKNLNDTIKNPNSEIISKFHIDCLEINEELVKLSPILKTVITPQEIFNRIIPRFFDCFDWYWQVRKKLARLAYKFAPKNKKSISELLDLKFNNDYDVLDSEYRIHDFVNYILIDNLISKYGNSYFDKNIKKILKEKRLRSFFATSLLKYANFKQDFRYKLISKMNLTAFLHNIYYDHLSNRYRNAHFNKASKLFKVNFHVNDARKAILNINEQYDLIFLDAFTFSKAPELWTVEFIAELYRRLSPLGIIMTYSNSALVRNTFLENNFYVGKIFNKKTGKYIGTIATKEKNLIEHPLSNYEIGLCNTRAGIPYHDPSLNLDKDTILKRREEEFKNSSLMTSSQYMRTRAQKNEDNNE